MKLPKNIQVLDSLSTECWWYDEKEDLMIDPRNWFEKAKWLLDGVYCKGLDVEVAEALKVAYELGLQDGLKKVKVDEEY